MRQALVPVHLIHSARTAAATSARVDAYPDLDLDLDEAESRRVRRARWGRRSRRLAARTGRGRVQA
jgi:hypothetical protein